jgi:two-component system copper resistance phosphate regulon response regulator CusR
MAGAKRILLLEEDLSLGRLLFETLGNAGYAVHPVSNVVQLRDAVETGDFDIVILDLDLTGTRAIGVRAIERVRAHPVAPPVLALSARNAVDDRVRGLDAGADDYLGKPFALAELLARVRVLLRRGQFVPERLQAGDLVLDCVRRRVTRAGQPVELGPKEFGILELLMRNHGRAVTRAAIVQHVWNLDYDGQTNIVDVYIRYLREKVDDSWSRKMIHTVRGTGYRLASPEER